MQSKNDSLPAKDTLIQKTSTTIVMKTRLLSTAGYINPIPAPAWK